MKPLTNERHVGLIEKAKSQEGWHIVEGDAEGRPMVEVRFVRKSGGRWISPRTAIPFRINARDARAIGAALHSIDDGSRS